MNKQQVQVGTSNFRLPGLLTLIAVFVAVGAGYSTDGQTGIAIFAALMLAIGGWTIFRDPPPPKSGGDDPAAINFGK